MTERLSLKAAALFFAIILWLIVSAGESTEKLVEVEFSPLITDSSVQVQSAPPRVSALVVGRGRDLLRLVGSPPIIRRAIGTDAPETMTFRLSPADVRVPSGVDVRDIQPREVTLRVAVMRSRLVPIVRGFSVVAESGLVMLAPPRMQPESAQITGRRSLVATIDSIVTERRLLVARDTAPILLPLDTAGLGVQVTPARVSVRVRVGAPAALRAPVTIDTARGEVALPNRALPDSLRQQNTSLDTVRRDTAGRNPARRDTSPPDTIRRIPARSDTTTRDRPASGATP
ncbi:MAG: hypothetical protein M3373_03355 [Gemmatimonadota bacterium]|nr:hypothetical protein [Gemmatimonadota bacterium]